MGRIKNYNCFINESFDYNIKREFIKLGVDDPIEMEKLIDEVKAGNLANHLRENGKKFTFGMLRAIFLDAQESKRKTDIRIGILKAVHRIVPMALAPFFPILAIIGYILGTSRAFNKVIAPILADPGNDYPQFLSKLISKTMDIAEGDILIEKDRFTKAFVVSDNLISVIRESVLRKFSVYLVNKMLDENLHNEVPDNYVENELKSYINSEYGVNPPIPLK